MSPTMNMSSNQRVGSYPMTQRLCECGTPLIAYFQTDGRYPYYHAAPPSPRPVLICPWCGDRTSRPRAFDQQQNPAVQYLPVFQTPQYQSSWHQWFHNGYHTSSAYLRGAQLMPPLHHQGGPSYNGGRGPPRHHYNHHHHLPPYHMTSGANDSSSIHANAGTEQPQRQPHQHQPQHPPPSSRRPSNTNPHYSGSADHDLAEAIRRVRIHSNLSPPPTSSASQHQRPVEPLTEQRLREATSAFPRVWEPAFWASGRAEAGSDSSRRSSGGSSSSESWRRNSSSSSRGPSRVVTTPTPAPSPSPSPPVDDSTPSEEDKDTDGTEHTEDADGEFPLIAFAENGDVVLLSDDFAVPSRNEAIREAGPTTGRSTVMSFHEGVDVHGNPTMVEVKEDMETRDLTMAGGLL